MRAIAVHPGRRDVSLVEIEEPRITQPTQVKLRMLEAGVCGTDREICAFEYGTPPEGSPHLVIGHESLGEVIEVGAAVRRPMSTSMRSRRGLANSPACGRSAMRAATCAKAAAAS